MYPMRCVWCTCCLQVSPTKVTSSIDGNHGLTQLEVETTVIPSPVVGVEHAKEAEETDPGFRRDEGESMPKRGTETPKYVSRQERGQESIETVAVSTVMAKRWTKRYR